MKPEAVAAAERVLGSATNWSRVQSRGYALGDRWLVSLADGRTAFAKRAINEQTAASLRIEHDVYTGLGAPFMPRLLGWEDGELPVFDTAEQTVAAILARTTEAQVNGEPPVAITIRGWSRGDAFRPATRP